MTLVKLGDIEKVAELFEVDLVVTLYTCDFNHCYNKYGLLLI